MAMVAGQGAVKQIDTAMTLFMPVAAHATESGRIGSTEGVKKHGVLQH